MTTMDEWYETSVSAVLEVRPDFKPTTNQADQTQAMLRDKFASIGVEWTDENRHALAAGIMFTLELFLEEDNHAHAMMAALLGMGLIRGTV